MLQIPVRSSEHFILNNRKTKRELKVYNNDKRLPFCPVTTFLGVKTGQITHVLSPSYGIAKKLSLRVTMLR